MEPLSAKTVNFSHFSTFHIKHGLVTNNFRRINKLSKNQYNSLLFLDVLVSKDNSKLSTTLYRKETLAGLYTLILPVCLLLNSKPILLVYLITVPFTFALHMEIFTRNFCKITTILNDNCFPQSLVDRMFKIFLY